MRPISVVYSFFSSKDLKNIKCIWAPMTDSLLPSTSLHYIDRATATFNCTSRCISSEKYSCKCRHLISFPCHRNLMQRMHRKIEKRKEKKGRGGEVRRPKT